MHYRQAAVFVLGCEVAPNGDRDGIPNVLMESMAMGVPVVATRAGSISELVEDGRTGLLVPPGQPRRFKRKQIVQRVPCEWSRRACDESRRRNWRRSAQAVQTN